MNTLIRLIGKLLRHLKLSVDKKAKDSKLDDKNSVTVQNAKNNNIDNKNFATGKKVEKRELDSKMLEVIKRYCDSTFKDCYSMQVVEGTPTPLDTHMGGLPYMPEGAKWPLDKEGFELPFLIQVNLEGINLPDFPDKGILQIFYRDETEEQEIRYYETVSDKYQDESCLPEWHYKEGYTCGTPLKIKLQKIKEVKHDYYDCEIFKEIFTDVYGEYDNSKYKDEINLISTELGKNMSKGNIGGWAESAQCAFSGMEGELTPRGNKILLFIDSMLHRDITLGDGGYIWVEIKPEDLKNKEFEKAAVMFDCY